MKINCKYEKLIPIEAVIEHEKNPNTHPQKQIELLAKMMKYQGWRHPIIISKLSGKCVAGHGRKKAAQLNGWTEVPVDMQDFDDLAQELSFLAGDNLIQDLAETDNMMLNEIAVSLGDDFDHELLGLEEQIVIPDENKDAIEDDVPDAPPKPISKLGDLYELGGHRLLCGDSTDKATVERLMNGQMADMVFTDPPYGMSAVSKSGVLSANKNYRGDILNDDTVDVAKDAYKLCSRLGVQKLVFWGANYYSSALPDATCWLVWDKNNGQSDQMDCELAWTNFKGATRQFTQASEKSNRVHPTQKPVALAQWCFDRWEAGSVLDIFGGSGSTLIACEKTNRKCYMMELDPHYVDVIVSRWCKYTGKTKIKRNGEDMDWLISDKPSLAE